MKRKGPVPDPPVHSRKAIFVVVIYLCMLFFLGCGVSKNIQTNQESEKIQLSNYLMVSLVESENSSCKNSFMVTWVTFTFGHGWHEIDVQKVGGFGIKEQVGGVSPYETASESKPRLVVREDTAQGTVGTLVENGRMFIVNVFQYNDELKKGELNGELAIAEDGVVVFHEKLDKVAFELDKYFHVGGVELKNLPKGTLEEIRKGIEAMDIIDLELSPFLYE